MEYAPEGKVEDIDENQFFNIVDKGDMVLSRKTAPLVSYPLEGSYQRPNPEPKLRKSHNKFISTARSSIRRV